MRPKSEPAHARPMPSGLATSSASAFPNSQRDRTASAGFLIVSFGMALSVVTVIVWVMHSLIAAANYVVEPRAEGRTLGIAEFLEKPEPPPPPTRITPAPVINELPPMPRMTPIFGQSGITGMAVPSFGVKDVLPPQQGKFLAIMHREVMPLAEVRPVYPPRLLERGIQGACAVFYTISATGVTRDIVVDESDCSHKGFGRAAAKAVSKYKYAPRIVDGEPQMTPNQRQHFRFLIDPQ